MVCWLSVGMSLLVARRLKATVSPALLGPVVVAAFEQSGIAALTGIFAEFNTYLGGKSIKYAGLIRRGGISLET